MGHVVAKSVVCNAVLEKVLTAIVLVQSTSALELIKPYSFLLSLFFSVSLLRACSIAFYSTSAPCLDRLKSILLVSLWPREFLVSSTDSIARRSTLFCDDSAHNAPRCSRFFAILVFLRTASVDESLNGEQSLWQFLWLSPVTGYVAPVSHAQTKVATLWLRYIGADWFDIIRVYVRNYSESHNDCKRKKVASRNSHTLPYHGSRFTVSRFTRPRTFRGRWKWRFSRERASRAYSYWFPTPEGLEERVEWDSGTRKRGGRLEGKGVK